MEPRSETDMPWDDLKQNLLAGTRLALFLPVRALDFRISIGQYAALVFVSLGLLVLVFVIVGSTVMGIVISRTRVLEAPVLEIGDALTGVASNAASATLEAPVPRAANAGLKDSLIMIVSFFVCRLFWKGNVPSL